jgi:hypothetical protein
LWKSLTKREGALLSNIQPFTKEISDESKVFWSLQELKDVQNVLMAPTGEWMLLLEGQEKLKLFEVKPFFREVAHLDISTLKQDLNVKDSQ